MDDHDRILLRLYQLCTMERSELLHLLHYVDLGTSVIHRLETHSQD